MANPARTASSPPLHPAEVIERVLRDVEKFPALLPVVQKALAVVEDENGSSGQLEKILLADSVTVARILRLANSAYFGVMTEVRTVSMAVPIIGYRKLRSLLRHILVAGLVELLSQRRPASAGIRETALATGSAAYQIAQRCGLEDPEELLVAGQLFNIGELALMWSFPQDYERVCARSGELSLTEAQQAAFGVDSLQVGRLVLESWRFPPVFCEIAGRWPRPLEETQDAMLRRYLAIIHVSAALASAHNAHTAIAPGRVSPEILAELQFSEDALRQVSTLLPGTIAAVRAMLRD